jgi:mRNA guanylyltransferase
MSNQAHPILGRPLPESKCDTLRNTLIQACGWNKDTFPGSQPVSFNRRNLEDITTKEYVVCEKSDGERFMFLHISDKEQFMTDRKFKFYRVNLEYLGLFGLTVLDGELIKDAEVTVRYLIYDAICIETKDMKNLNLLDRLKGIQKTLQKQTPLTASSGLVTFPVYLKDFFDVKHSVQVYKQIASRLPHYCDGLIFTPVKLRYMPGTCKQLLKWKPADMNTVDFALELIIDNTTAAGDKTLFHGKLLSAESGVQGFKNVWLARGGPQWEWLETNWYKANNKIIECNWDPNISTFIPNSTSQFTTDGRWVEGGGWVLMRVRDDRTTPNDASVVEKVKDSIRDGIGVEELENAISAKYGNSYKKPRLE